MKLNKITALVKKSKRFDIYTDSQNVQWICVNDAAIYPLYGFPHITTDIEIMLILGLDITTHKEWKIEFFNELPENIDFYDLGGFNGKDLTLSKMHVSMSDENGVDHWLLKPNDSEKILFVKEKYILPVFDCDDFFGMAMRVSTPSLREYIAVFNGMSLTAIILPTSAGKTIIDILDQFTKNVQLSDIDYSFQRMFSNYSFSYREASEEDASMEIDEE